MRSFLIHHGRPPSRPSRATDTVIGGPGWPGQTRPWRAKGGLMPECRNPIPHWTVHRPQSERDAPSRQYRRSDKGAFDPNTKDEEAQPKANLPDAIFVSKLRFREVLNHRLQSPHERRANSP